MRLASAVFLVALATLTVELLLTRVFDVILYPNLAYMVITCAMLALGLAGIVTAIRPATDAQVQRRLPLVAAAFGASLLAIRPALNAIPFWLDFVSEQPATQAFWFALMYLVVGVPFFLSGYALALVFAHHGNAINRLYGADLAGAALGCVVLIPLLRPFGPSGLLFFAAAAAFLAAALLEGHRGRRRAFAVAAALAVLVPMVTPPLEFEVHKYDRGLTRARMNDLHELSIWDSISKIDVVGWGQSKNILYDGGTQSSFLYPFDGDFEALRTDLDSSIRRNKENRVQRHFWYRGVFASHYLKRDGDHRALIIGSAAGQEVKAALVYGAAAVEAVELVPAVVELGKDQYADFNGQIFNHPKVVAVAGEGRAYLRSRPVRFDVIQLHSDHSSSSIAGGVGALDPAYLMTTDAFTEYYEHLSDDGILHINHHIYPRIVATAAKAWVDMGRTDFQSHVLVVHRAAIADTLPTLLIKMTPWTPDEVREVRYFFSLIPRHESAYAIVENPLATEESFLSPEFYSGNLSRELLSSVPYRLRPTTDNRPYFKFLRRGWGPIEIDSSRFVDAAMQHLLNEPVERGPGVPMDVLHLVTVGGVGFGAVLLFVVLPLLTSKVGRSRFPGMASALLYFSCLGFAFIVIELVLIQKFMKFIGSPLHTYSTVLFTVLLAAGLGSMAAGRLGITPGRRAWVPFAGIIGVGLAFLASHTWLFATLLSQPTGARVLISAAIMFPLAFFMGMPFPLGVLAVNHHGPSAIAWAWAMNGVFTLIGGLASVVLSLQFGFTVTEALALLVYALAGVVLLDYQRRQAVL